MLAYILNKDLSHEVLIKDIAKLLSRYDLSKHDHVLVIKVEKVQHSIDSYIPKLEYKP